jgi:hypothetical protein
MRLAVALARHDGGSEVIVVDSHPSQKGNILMIYTLFEPNRLEQSSLQIAYEHVVPVRQLPAVPANTERQTDTRPSLPRRSV